MPLASPQFRSILIGILSLTVIGCSEDSKQASSTNQPNRAANSLPIRLLDLDNKPVDFLPTEQNQISVVIFTRSDCPISNRFAPEIRRLYVSYHPRGVEFNLIYVDPKEQPDAIRQHLKEYQYPCSGLRDPRHTLVKYCEATTTPEAVVFSRDRKIVYMGRINDLYAELGKPRAEPTTHDLEDAIKATVLGKPIATSRTKSIGCLIADLEE
jgi:hypothetical protein